MLEPASLSRPWWWRPRVLVPLTIFLLFLVAVRGVAGYFLPTAETATPRKSAVRCLGGEWHKRVGVHVGWVTTAALRFGTRPVYFAKEAPGVLRALDAGDGSIFCLRGRA